MFKWAAGQELLPAIVFQQLKMVEALRRGRSAAVEKEPVRPVASDLVDAIRPFVSRQVWALIELQRLTGARGGELFPLRPIDLQMDEKTGVWSYTPADHKTQHLSKGRALKRSSGRSWRAGRSTRRCSARPKPKRIASRHGTRPARRRCLAATGRARTAPSRRARSPATASPRAVTSRPSPTAATARSYRHRKRIILLSRAIVRQLHDE